MISILATSNGITFYLHHCHCHDKLLVSMSEMILCADDHHTQNTHDCCLGDYNGVHVHLNSESCGCENESITLKLVDASISDGCGYSINDYSPQYMVNTNTHFADHLIKSEINGTNPATPPPLLVWGKQLVTLYQCPKTPEHIS